jgi:hypothetical protein
MAATSRKGGSGEICSVSMRRGDYEAEAALLEPGVQRERARRKGATTTGELRARPALYACTSSKERGRESSAMSKEGVVPRVDLVEQFLVLPCLFMRSTRIEAEKRGEQTYWAP